jgi:hypothetical protein
MYDKLRRSWKESNVGRNLFERNDKSEGSMEKEKYLFNGIFDF